MRDFLSQPLAFAPLPPVMRFTSMMVALATTTASVLGQVDFDGSESALHASNDSLLWGTYRPNLYFGLRPRLPATLLTGLMWFGATDYQGFSSEFRPRSRFFAHTSVTAHEPPHRRVEACLRAG